ncbi:protein zwilch homolog [Procambarus clarkii]|uniref:protein zwilch homolog n=1 Tax=Procambarus clarkii TaxID=6728 RepID=UPI001E671BE0|nr:protein zwilch homolog [Procambarus clarkii]
MEDTYEVQHDEIQALLKRLLLKSDCGEHVVVDEEKLVVSREACPAVLLPTNKNCPEIILIQRLSQHNKRLLRSGSNDSTLQTVTPVNAMGSTPAKVRICSYDLDVTGSPLKCSFMQDGYETDFSPFGVSLLHSKKNKHTLSYTPVGSTKAVLIASKFNLALSKMSDDIKEFLPLWVVCDGSDARGTLFIGLQRSEDKMSRSIVTSSGSYQGFENLPSLDHLKLHHTAIGPTKRVESAVEAVFNVLNSDEDDKGSSLRLICNWKKPLTILSNPAPYANTTASLRIVCSDPRSAAHQMYKELNMLRGFVSGIESGEVAWFIREGSVTIAQEMEEVFAIIREKGQRQKKEDDDGISDFDMLIKGTAFNRRQNMDFTDLLWTVLIKCESFQELKENLSLVFNAVASGEIRPQIHVRNSTQVGNLSRDLMRGHEMVSDLSGLLPLHMLIEIGCEKIKRDYINIFQAGELATGVQLSWFVSNSEDSTEMVIIQLERLHVALQAVLALYTYLSLPPASLTQITEQVLNQLKEEEPRSAYSFSFRLETLTVHKLLSSMKPSTWELNLGSSHGNFAKTLMCHISHDPLIQFQSTANELEELADGDDEREGRFYCNFITTVTDKIFR